MPATEVVILDDTRMSGDNVCIAGVCKDPKTGAWREVRPVPPLGCVKKAYIEGGAGCVIEPFSLYIFNFTRSKADGPHIEDMVFEDRMRGSVRFVKKLDDTERIELLEAISRNSLEEIYGPNLVERKFIYEGQSGNSLGCIIPLEAPSFWVTLRQYQGAEPKLEVRMIYKDGPNTFDYPVVERRVYDYAAKEFKSGRTEKEIQRGLNRRLHSAGKVYLRFGMSRPFPRQQDLQEGERAKCYVQILGVHTVPDYFPATEEGPESNGWPD